jgi:predicted nucleic acid-binding protein
MWRRGARAAPERLDAYEVETHETGSAQAERYNLSIYDAMIAAAALHAGCDTLWSEDMQDGMAFGEGLRIVNPFRAIGR